MPSHDTICSNHNNREKPYKVNVKEKLIKEQLFTDFFFSYITERIPTSTKVIPLFQQNIQQTVIVISPIVTLICWTLRLKLLLGIRYIIITKR